MTPLNLDELKRTIDYWRSAILAYDGADDDCDQLTLLIDRYERLSEENARLKEQVTEKEEQ